MLAVAPDPRRGGTEVQASARVAVLHSCHRDRLQLVSGIVTFIDVHRRRANAAFGLKWRRALAHTAIRYILKGLNPAGVEVVFRQHAALLQAARATPGQGSIALDGKALRGSFDTVNDRAAAQVLNAFATDTSLVLAYIDIPPHQG